MKFKVTQKDLNKYFYSQGQHFRLKGGGKEIILEGEPVEGIEIAPSPRIDYCCECDAEHGYDCPKDLPQPIKEIEFDDHYPNDKMTKIFMNEYELGQKLNELIRDYNKKNANKNKTK